MSTELELRARSTIAGACAHLAKDNYQDAVNLVNLFLNDQIDEGVPFPKALESLARAGIIVSMLAAEPDVEETFARITTQLAMSEIK